MKRFFLFAIAVGLVYFALPLRAQDSLQTRQTLAAANGQPRFVPAADPQAAASADDNWDWRFGTNGVNNSVYAIAVSGSQGYVGGAFTQAGGNSASYIVKLKSFGSPTMGGGVNGTVWAMAVSGTNVYVGGQFTTAGGVTVNRIARWDGSSWSPLGYGVNGTVYAVAVDGNDVYVAGSFTGAWNVQGGIAIPVSNVAHWNGSSWSALGYGVSGTAYGIGITANGHVFVGGFFTSAWNSQGAVAIPVSNIAKWDGSTWAALGTGLNNGVNALAVNGNNVYVGGAFTTAGGNAANYVARWTDSLLLLWWTLGSGAANGVNGNVYTLALNGSDVYVGGPFTAAGGNAASRIAKWDGSTWSALGSGTDSSVETIAVSGTDVFVGGDFSTAGGLPASHLARWTGSTWLTIWGGLNAPVGGTAISGTDVYVCGAFTTAGDRPAYGLAKWDGVSWGPPNWPSTSDELRAIAVSGTDLYLLDNVISTGPQVFKWNGSSWTSLGGPGCCFGYAMAVSGNTVYICGAFSVAGGGDVAKWDGSTWSALGGFAAGDDYALAINGSDVYLGGLFTLLPDLSSAKHVAKWNGSSWSALGTGANNGVDNTVFAIAVNGSDVFVGGDFDGVGGDTLPASCIAKWNGASWSALGSGLTLPWYRPYCLAMTMNGGDLYVVGDFTSAGGVAAGRIAKWDGTSWSTLASGVSTTAEAVAVSDTDVYVGGRFQAAGGKTSARFGRWFQGATSSNNRITGITKSGTDIIVSFATYNGFTYALERTDNLINPSWTPVQSGIAGNGSIQSATDTGGASQSKRFYHIKATY